MHAMVMYKTCLPVNQKDASKAMWSSKSGELPNPPWSWTERAQRVMDKIIVKAEKKAFQSFHSH